MKNIKNSAVAEKSLAAHRLLKIKSTEDKSYQISAENCLRKRDWYGLVHFSQRKRCGNAAETRNATSFCSYVFPPSGNVTETWTIRFPQDFRNTETPYFTLCQHVTILKCRIEAMGPGPQQLHSVNYVDITSYQQFSKSVKCLSLLCFFWAALLMYWAVVSVYMMCCAVASVLWKEIGRC